MALFSKVVDHGGTGSYTSLQAYNDAFGGVPGNGACVANQYQARATFICTDGVLINEFNFYGWTSTSKTYFVEIYVPPAYRHQGYWPAATLTNVARVYQNVAPSGVRNMIAGMAFRCTGLAVKFVTDFGAAGFLYNALAITDPDVFMFEIYDCAFFTKDCSVNGGKAVWVTAVPGISSGTPKVIVANSILECPTGNDESVGISQMNLGNAGTIFPDVYVYNNTIIGGRRALNSADGWKLYSRNNLFYGSELADIAGFSTQVHDHPASVRAGGTSRVDLTGVAVTDLFAGYAARNYLLKFSGTNVCYRTGADLHEDSVVPITTDFRGKPRWTQPCIGAYETDLDEALISSGNVGGGNARAHRLRRLMMLRRHRFAR
jgi:hypothetical protein